MRRAANVLRRAPVLAFLAAAAAASGLAVLIRYQVVEPAAMGAACGIASPPFWCPLRTGFIVVTEINGLGIGAVILAVASLFARPRTALKLVLTAAVVGGAGLWLYNTTWSAPAVLLALLRATRLGESQPQMQKLEPDKGEPG